MTDTATDTAPAFSIQQHATLAAWSANNPTRLKVTIQTDCDAAEEVAEIGHSPRLALWVVHPLPTGGGVMLVDSDGVGWAVAGLAAALAEIEKRGLAMTGAVLLKDKRPRTALGYPPHRHSPRLPDPL